MLRQALRQVPEALWLIFLACLPLTSFPLVSRLVGSAMVTPPAGLVVAALVLVWFLPALLRRMPLPPQARPLLLFGAAAVLSSLASFFILFPLFRQVNFARHILEACLTLAVGLCTYLVVSSYPASPEALAKALRWINWSGLVMLAWALAQAFFYVDNRGYPDWMTQVQGFFSTSKLFDRRITGFAFEPSWLAHQLNMLYLPLWLAATAGGASAHRRRLLGISFENVLLVGGVAALGLSLSRVGWLAFLLMVGLLLVKANLALLRWINLRLQGGFQKTTFTRRLASRLVSLVLVLALLAFYVGLLAGAAYALNKVDVRMSKMFDFTALAMGNTMEYINQLSIAERVVFWQTGWEVFNDHPLLGVGLGNAGYYFPEKLPAFGWSLTEINYLIYAQGVVPNTKSLWSRLLAETGLAGFSLFGAWLLLGWFSAASLAKKKIPVLRWLGLAGQLALAALLVEGFSIDSFALPYLWVTLGLSLAAWRVGRLPSQT